MSVLVNAYRWGNRKNARAKNKEGIIYESDLRCALQKNAVRLPPFLKFFRRALDQQRYFF